MLEMLSKLQLLSICKSSGCCHRCQAKFTTRHQDRGAGAGEQGKDRRTGQEKENIAGAGANMEQENKEGAGAGPLQVQQVPKVIFRPIYVDV